MASSNTIAIRQRLAALDIFQWALAKALGVSQGALSQWLRDLPPLPAGMEARIDAALDQIEEEQRVAAEAIEKLRAERAAQEARERALAEEAE